jgi:hypothetical protein
VPSPIASNFDEAKPVLKRNQRGQAVPFIVIFVFFVLSMLAIIIWLGDAAALRAKAQAGADAVALAGAAGGKDAANSEAKANRVELTRFEKLGADARVVVKLGKISATARATSNSVVVNKLMSPALRAAVSRAETLSGKRVFVVHSAVASMEVTPGTELWLAQLSDSTGLCPSGANVFEICQ